MRLILIRHGESEGNKNHKIYGWTDYPLTDKGLLQVNEITTFMRNQNYHKLYTSPLLRARYIAEQLFNNETNNVLSLIEDSRIKEMNCGIFEGLTEEEVLANFKQEYTQFLSEYETYSIPEGESYPEFKARVLEFLEDALPKEDEIFVYVTHGGVIREIMTYLMKLEPGKVWDYPIYPGCIIEMELNEGCWHLSNILQTGST